jgi:hypothetical protein
MFASTVTTGTNALASALAFTGKRGGGRRRTGRTRGRRRTGRTRGRRRARSRGRTRERRRARTRGKRGGFVGWGCTRI